MSFEDLLARINLLIRGAEMHPEDPHELLEQLHLELNQMRATGQVVPEDLARLEQRLENEFADDWAQVKARGAADG